LQVNLFRLNAPDYLTKEFGFDHLVDGDLKLQFIELAAHAVHKVPAYYFRMVHLETSAAVGAINLRVGSTPHLELYAGHIGYAVDAAHRGHRYAARSVRLLAAVAQQLHFDVLWITCDPENISSRRTAELSGAQLVEIVDVPEHCIIHQAGHKRKCRYRLVLARL
jgi:tagatose 1,6-diphosphate aldolase